MSITRFSKCLLVVLGLALWAGTASAQIQTDTPTVNFSYTKGSVTAAQNASISDGGTNAYTNGTVYNLASGANQWLTATPTTGTTTDTLALSVNTSAANAMAPGSTYSATVTVTDSSDSTTATITVNLTVLSPLSSSAPTSAILTFVKTGGGSQPAASATVTVSNTDSSYDTYTTVIGGTCPNWLNVVSANTKQAKSGTNDTLTFSIDATKGAAASPTSITTCSVQLQYNGVAFKTVAFTSLNIVAQPLLSSVSSVSLNYVKGGTGAITGSASVSVAANTSNTAFAIDVATVPLWLTVSPTSGTASTGGVSVTFTVVNNIAAGMATGNYSVNVGFAATGYSDLLIPVNFSISNSAPSVTLKEGTTQINGIWAPGSPLPTPTVTPFSSNEPVPFTATCTVVSTYAGYSGTTPCTMNGGSAGTASGVAYTWGFPLLVSFDPTLFTAPLGTQVKVTVAVSPQGSSSLSLAYQYTLQPVAPTITSISPTSTSQIAVGNSLIVLLKGTGFVGPQNLNGSTIVPTQVWLGANATPLSGSSYVVLSATQMMVTIPQTSFPTYATGKTSATLTIGLANQTGVAAPTTAQASTTLLVTNAPVVYGITSTATYVQPAIGANPKIAPYELVSIFGDNFGFTGTNFATGTLNAFSQYPTSLVVVPGKTPVSLSVVFKDGKNNFSAPILFANQNQINLAVPSGLTISDTVTLTVTSGTASSDGLFQATVAANDPGIFTLTSDGTGQAAIINHDGTINASGNGEHAGNYVSIYVTGMGAPDSTAFDMASNSGAVFPTNCVAVSNTTKGTPGYLQVVNTAATGYVPPTPAWTSIDGAVILGSKIVAGLPPCMTDPISVTFGSGAQAVTATTGNGGVLWAGFASGSVAGLYQINVTIPNGAPTGNTVPVSFTIGSSTTPTVTMAIQ
jgi:uncharacterized protein (TIGR03437 family)